MIDHQTKDQIVAETLRAEIRDGILQSGERLNQAELARRFGVSLAPIREALRALEAGGLIRLRAHRGAEVTGVTRKDIIETAHVRRLLEVESVKLIAGRLNPQSINTLLSLQEDIRSKLDLEAWDDLGSLNSEFHMALHESSGQRRLISHIKLMLGSIYWNESLVSKADKETSIEQHEMLLKALVFDKDGEKAARMMKEHINTWENMLLPQFACE